MKLATQKGLRLSYARRQAFTLIEMIGVLAVIGILASMLIPRVFEAINTARVTSTIVSCEAVKAAAADHYGKYGKFDMLNNGTLIDWSTHSDGVYSGYDTNVLMPEGLLDKSFSARIAGGDPNVNSAIQLVKVQGGGTPNLGAGGTGYKLDGINVATANAQLLLEAVIKGVSIADAKDLNDRIDGVSLGTTDLISADTKGRVEYITPSGGTTDVYVYLAHR